MKLTCRKSATGPYCRFDEAHHLSMGTEYSLTVVADDFRRSPGDAVAELSVPGTGAVASSVRLEMDPTGVYRDRAHGVLVTTGGAYDDLLSAALADRAERRVDGPVVSKLRFRVAMDDGRAPFIDTVVPIVLSARPCPPEGED